MKAKSRLTLNVVMCIALIAASGSAAAIYAGCRSFTEHLPMSVGGGCVHFDICCYGNYCEASNIVDSPGFCL